MKIFQTKNRIRMLTTTSLVTYIYLVLTYFGSGIEDAKLGWAQGYGTAQQTFYSLNVNSKENILYFPFELTNKMDQKQVTFRPSMMKLQAPKNIKKSKKIKTEETLIYILIFGLTILFFYIPFTIHKLIKSLRYGDFFCKKNENNFRKIGKILGTAFFITMAIDLLDYNISKSLFDFAEFNITKERPSFIWLICGLLFLIFAEILKNGIEIKKENALTV